MWIAVCFCHLLIENGIVSFHHTHEGIHDLLLRLQEVESIRTNLFQYIEGRYNRNRIHSAIGYKTPQQME
ncbi:IS3 family transposase [Paenibacillus sp. DS2015]|uniref:IS3 family transposase n=1 Tax=Paenibacillus sp. DS2015 TaxID=3373917 RepID=UPI003D216AAF